MGRGEQTWVESLAERLRKAVRPASSGLDLRALFERFQAVLENNNRSLEVITDMGEKLGGDYLFDINYTRAAFASLHEAISSSIHNFDLLTQGKYPELAETLSRIDTLVQRVLTSSAGGSGRLVVFYPDMTWDLADEVGGKNFHLAEMANTLHLRVPPAFAVTTEAFDSFVDHNDLRERIGLLASRTDEAFLAELRGAVQEATLPPALASAFGAMAQRLGSLSGLDCKIAVRSSAEEEDGDFSFAGQFGTELNVPCTAPAIGEAYKRVIASLFQPNALAYQRQLGYEPGRLRMAVACVVMVEARVSGVIFTATAGAKDTLMVSSAWGLGKAVVDGLTDADLYTVRKGPEPEILSTKVGRKELMVAGRGTEGVETLETPSELRGQACLSEAQVLDLARQAMAIEAHFKRP